MQIYRAKPVHRAEAKRRRDGARRKVKGEVHPLRYFLVKLTFVSNYINHHQIPFCEALLAHSGVDFRFLQTEPMERERVAMGWSVDVRALPYVDLLYEDEAAGRQRIMESDLVLFGWTEREELAQERMTAGKPTVRVSERLYREGQWKAISPRGLLRKYQEHTRFRNGDCYLLCAGAYVASDFALIHSYPEKMYRFGYFPRTRHYTEAQLDALKGWGKKESGDAAMLADTGYIGNAALSEAVGHDGGAAVPTLLWAGRFLPLKHPEFALRLAKSLRDEGLAFSLQMVGGGEMDGALRAYAAENGLSDCVTFCGFLPPDEVRARMERSQIFLFTSNHLEGWGAVVNEAMNSGCAVVAGSEAGAVPFLLRHGENGLIFNGEDEADFRKKARFLLEQGARRRALGLAAYRTIVQEWNAETAAARFLDFADCVLRGAPYEAPAAGPMSRAEILRPFVRV